jgi:hypothetical protein
MGEQREAGRLRVQGQHQETSITTDQSRVNSGFIPSPPDTTQANRAHKVQECKIVVVESTTRMMLHLRGLAWLAGNSSAANLSLV